MWFTHWAAGAGAITHRFIIVVDTAKNTRFFGGSCHASTSDVDALLRFVGKDRVCNAAAFFNVDVLIWFFYFLLFFLQTITVSYRNDRNGHAKYQEELDRRCHLLKEVVGKFETCFLFLCLFWRITIKFVGRRLTCYFQIFSRSLQALNTWPPSHKFIVVIMAAPSLNATASNSTTDFRSTKQWPDYAELTAAGWKCRAATTICVCCSIADHAATAAAK